MNIGGSCHGCETSIRAMPTQVCRRRVPREIGAGAGATSALTAEASYTAFYRREWGCESVWGHARVRVARIEYVTGGAPAPSTMGAGGFDPADHATFAQATAFRFGGPPRGQAR